MTRSGMLVVVGDERVGSSLVCVQQLRVHRRQTNAGCRRLMTLIQLAHSCKISSCMARAASFQSTPTSSLSSSGDGKLGLHEPTQCHPLVLFDFGVAGIDVVVVHLLQNLRKHVPMRPFELFWEGRNVKDGLLGIQELMVGFYVHPTVVNVVRQSTPSVTHSCRPGFDFYQLVLAVIGIIGTLRIARDVGEGLYNHLFGSLA